MELEMHEINDNNGLTVTNFKKAINLWMYILYKPKQHGENITLFENNDGLNISIKSYEEKIKVSALLTKYFNQKLRGFYPEDKEYNIEKDHITDLRIEGKYVDDPSMGIDTVDVYEYISHPDNIKINHSYMNFKLFDNKVTISCIYRENITPETAHQSRIIRFIEELYNQNIQIYSNMLDCNFDQINYNIEDQITYIKPKKIQNIILRDYNKTLDQIKYREPTNLFEKIRYYFYSLLYT